MQPEAELAGCRRRPKPSTTGKEEAACPLLAEHFAAIRADARRMQQILTAQRGHDTKLERS